MSDENHLVDLAAVRSAPKQEVVEALEKALATARDPEAQVTSAIIIMRRPDEFTWFLSDAASATSTVGLLHRVAYAIDRQTE